MNKEYESTYALLVRSEERGRGIMEMVAYALLGLSVIVSILQFVAQPNPLPMGLITKGYEVSRASQPGVEAAVPAKS